MKLLFIKSFLRYLLHDITKLFSIFIFRRFEIIKKKFKHDLYFRSIEFIAKFFLEKKMKTKINASYNKF